jgi:hypothetical protein
LSAFRAPLQLVNDIAETQNRLISNLNKNNRQE